MSEQAAAGTAGATRRLLGWGGAVSAEGEVLRARSADDVRAVYARARAEGRSIALRGAGCSYGDAALNAGGLVLEIGDWNRVLAFDPATGVVDAEPGVTVRDLWTLGLPHGYWPPVVSGTMVPTLGGALGMNIHGKNSFAVGTLGEHVLEFDLLTPDGATLQCSRDRNADVFRAAIGGFGMLGSFARIRLRLKKVPGGRVAVTASAPRNFDEAYEYFEREKSSADYLVGWHDSFGRGGSLGRGIVHKAVHAGPESDPDAAAALAVVRQELPRRIMGVLPRSWAWRCARPFVNDWGMRCVNAAKLVAGRLGAAGPPKLQSHAAFAFLLDYVPHWKKSYGRGGLIQYQSFVPAVAAARVHGELVRRAQDADLTPYLLVSKRHRRDDYLLTHSIDGFSLAMDFRVTAGNRARLWALCRRLDDVVAAAGGRFYFAKDATLARDSFLRTVPEAELAEFAALKRRLDPENLLQTELSRRLFDFASGPATPRPNASAGA